MNKKFLDIVPIGKVNDTILHRLSITTNRCFGCPSRINEEWEIPSYAYNPIRNQYHATRILKELCERVNQDSVRTIGITNLDLFIPIFTFVFGEAQLEGHCAILSLGRLRQEFYRLPPDDELFLSRVDKETIHELSHTFGLTHCKDVHCVMHASYSIADTDIKSGQFCKLCNKKLALRLKELKKLS